MVGHVRKEEIIPQDRKKNTGTEREERERANWGSTRATLIPSKSMHPMS
jgi:hypothetical protein